MFSLRTKLTAALLVTGLAAASIVGAVAQWMLWQKFSTAIMTRSFESFQEDVAAYFTTYGTFEKGMAVQPFGQFVSQRHQNGQGPRAGGPPGGGPRGLGSPLNPLLPPPPNAGPPRAAGIGPRGERRGAPDEAEQPPFRFLLLDPEGRVLLPNPPYQPGETAPANLRASGLPIKADGRQVAIAVALDTPNLSEQDHAYLAAMSQALWFGIGVAAVIAVLLGLVFGTTLSRTLRRLTAALQAVGAGDLRQHVETKAHDETGILAEAFNKMSAALAQSTERVRAQAAQLEVQNEELREAVKLREEVDRIARHDLKTPLGTVIGVPRLLREEGSLGPEQDELLGIVERAGYRLLNMVNLSLDLFKIEQGSYRVRPQVLDIHRLLQTVLSDVAPHASAKRVTTGIVSSNGNGAEPEPVYAWAEELLCYSLLANLLKNAVEASNEGATVSIAVRELDGVFIDIHNGGAVPAEVRDRFFEKYATSGKVGGSGLGTYSARMMARVQGGDITMTSSAAAGTTLSVRLPEVPASVMADQEGFKAEEERAAGSSAAALMPALRVLLVDDDEYNRLVLGRYLAAPLVVSTAVNGRDAVEAAVANPPDVILMDVDMPGMDGLEASRKVREQEATLGRPPCVIIALSSYDDDVTRQRSEAAGCNVYLTKPVTRTALQSAIREATRSRTPQAPAQSSASPKAVDVDPETRDLLPDFIQSRREVLDEIEHALDNGDLAQLRRASHRLAGSLGLYGFHWASDQARRLETEAQNGNRAMMAELLSALRSHLDTVASDTKLVPNK